MSTKYMLHGVPTILTKGAVDVLLDRCDYVRCSDGIRPMTEAEKGKIRMQNQLFSENGLRVLSFAYKESDENLDIHAEYGLSLIHILIDEEVLNSEYFGCHPCINTSSLRMRTEIGRAHV